MASGATQLKKHVKKVHARVVYDFHGDSSTLLVVNSQWTGYN